MDTHVGLMNFGNNVHKSVPWILPSKDFEQQKRELHFGHSQISPFKSEIRLSDILKYSKISHRKHTTAPL
jgi:hypothetical protein